MKIFSTKLPSFITNVDDKLYRGRAISCPYRLYSLKKNGINQVIDLRNSFSFTKYMEKFFCKILGIKYINCKYKHRLKKIPNEEFFLNIKNLILMNKSKTYLHCQKGKRRTGFLAAYYEKNVMHLPDKDILNNLINLGYNDIKVGSKAKNKYFNILSEFIDKYLPETKNT